MVVLPEGSPISTEELGNSVRVTIRFLVTSQIKALLPRLLSLAGWTALGSLGGSKLLPLKNEALCSWGPSMLQTFFGTLPQICASTQTCLGCLRTIPSTSLLGFCSDMHCQKWDLIWTGVCLSKSCPINWIYHRWTPIKLSTSMETGCTWAQFRVSSGWVLAIHLCYSHLRSYSRSGNVVCRVHNLLHLWETSLGLFHNHHLWVLSIF